MYNVSDEFKAIALNNTRELAIKGTLQTDTTTYELTAEDFEQGRVTFRESCMSKGFELGTATAKECTIELNNRDGSWDDVVLDGATLTIYCGYKLSSSTEYVPMGVFIVDQPGRPYSSLQIKATDRMILFDEPLTDVVIGYPTTQKALIQAICQHCNVPISGEILTLPSTNNIVPEPEDLDKLTCRDAIGEIALMAGGFARCNRNGYLEIVQIAPLNDLNAHTMPIGSRKNFKQLSDPITITGMKYDDLSWGDDTYPLEIKKLSLIDPDNINTILSNVFNQINGFTYTAYTADYFGNPAIDAGDTILHKTKDGKMILTFITKHDYKHGGNCKMQAEGTSKSAVNYKSANERRMTRIAAQAALPLEHNLNSYQQSTAVLNDLIGKMLGVYRTEEEFEDGSKKYWFHDKPTMAESQIIWGFNGVALVYSSDGGQSWSGIDAASDTVVAKIVSALQIRAEQIILTGTSTTLDNEISAIHTDIENIELTPGPQGDSAYQVAVASGFVGTQAEWLASLVGEPGQDGANYTIGSDGFWYLNGTKTSYRALGEKGDKGDDGRGVQSIKEYYLASAQSSGVTTSTSGWTETPQTITKAKPYLWNYSVTTYTTGATHTDQPVIIGTVGDDGKGIQSVQEYYLISNQATGVTHSTSGWVTTPPSFTDAKRFLWNYEKITYTDSSVTNTAPALIGVKGEQGDNFAWNLLKGTSDQLKQVSISGWGVTNASSLHPDNANLFSDGVISAGDTVTLRVWLDASQSAYPVRASIRYPNNGNPNRNTTTNLIPAGQSGWATATATIPDDTTNFFVLITVFNQGSTPSQNIGYKYLMLNKGDAQPWSPHPDDLKALQTYTWIRYADSATGSGISNDPTGKTYIGFAYNKTTATESNTPSDYTWSLIKGTDGQPGAPGQDGTTTYTWIKYSDNADGTGLYDLPKSTTEYIGIAVNKTTATESTNKADYTWSKFRGGQGVPGTDGTGIQSIIVEYGISGTTAPTTWSTTPPESWDDDKYLWIRNKITYTDSTVAYAGTNRLSDVEAQRALVKAKEYTDNVKIGGKNIIKNSNDFSAFYAYSGATLTKTENVSVSEWNATDATNLKTTGGTNVLKIIQRYEVPEVIHKEIVTYSIYVKNNGTNNITVRVNGVGAGTSETIEPGAAVRFVRFGGYRSEAYYNWFQFQIYASNAAENIDVDLWHDQLERGNKETDWSPAPEDFQTQITENRNDIDQYGMRVTEVEHTVNGYGSEVGLVTRMTNVEAGEITLSTLTNGVLAGMTLSSSMLRATGGGYGVQVSGTSGYLPFYVGDGSFSTTGAQFYVDWSGFLYAKNANIEGTVVATAGMFAGLTISQNTLRAISGDYGVQISGVAGNLPLYVGDTTFTANGAQFYVDWTGHLYSKSANIEGTFVATGGSIGGLTISDSTLRTARDGYGVQVSGAAGYLPFYVGNSSFSAAGAKFYVDWSGYLFANNASIKGSIQAGSVIAGQLNDTTGTHRGSHVGSYAGTASTYSGSSLGGSLDYTIGSHNGSINCNTGVLGNVSFNSVGSSLLNFAGAVWCDNFKSRNNVVVDYNISYGGTLTHTSDKNLKTDIELPDVDTYLDSFYSLKVKNFVFKNDENKKRRLGIVAQDFIEDNSNNLIKEVVVPIEGYFHVNYEHLYLMNILATQDLNSRLKRLEEKLSA